MFLASLHAFVPILSFTSGGFVGYVTMFSVHAGDSTAFGVPRLSGEMIIEIVSMFVG